MRLAYAITLVVVGIAMLYMLESHREGVVFSGASPYNTRWDGTSNLVDHLKTLGNVEIVDKWFPIPGVDEGYSCKVILVVSPEKKFREEEVRTIADLVKNRGYNLIILDEGHYSNALLEALGLPLRIEAFRFVKVYTELATPTFYSRYIIAEEAPGFIELDRLYYLVFFYVSPINIGKDTHRCRVVAYTVDGSTVGVMCYTQRGRVLVVGDGSIAINAIIPPTPLENMYTLVMKRIVNYICDNNTKNLLFLVDSSKYRLRTLTFSELAREGYRGIEILILTLNPFRYLYTYIANNEPPLLAVFSIGIASGFAIAVSYVAKKHAKGLHEELPRDVYMSIPGYGRSTIKLVVDLCRSDNQCVDKVPCVLKNIDKRCIKILSNYISRSRVFRRKLVDKILGYR